MAEEEFFNCSDSRGRAGGHRFFVTPVINSLIGP